MGASVKLNLGCGFDKREGFINADSFADCQPDVLMDIEKTPWPFEDNRFEHILMRHVLEHVGETRERFFAVIRELYRVCKPNATVEIHVPHFLHKTFYSDPTHVRPITDVTMRMLSKAQNETWIAERANYTMLAKMLDVDFVIKEAWQTYDDAWKSRMARGDVSLEEVREFALQYAGVIHELRFVLRAVK